VASVAPRTWAALAPTAIAKGCTLLTGGGGNVLVVETADGVVLVDSGAAEYATELMPAVAAIAGGAPVRTLFNTHWHPDQVGANEIVGKAGAAIIAHKKTLQHLATPYYLPAERRYQPAAPTKARPTQTFYTTGETTVGGRRIEYGHLLEAHTDGDAYVYFRDANVLAVGDAVASEGDPELDWFGGGWLGGRVDSLKRLLDISNVQTKFVPSHGAVVGRAQVQAEHDTLVLLFERFVDRIRKGESSADMLAAGIMEGTGRVWRDAAKFVHDAHKGFVAHQNTLAPDIN